MSGRIELSLNQATKNLMEIKDFQQRILSKERSIENIHELAARSLSELESATKNIIAAAGELRKVKELIDSTL